MEMEKLKLADVQAKALLKSPTPLADVYDAWGKVETHHMDDISKVIENRANEEKLQPPLMRGRGNVPALR